MGETPLTIATARTLQKGDQLPVVFHCGNINRYVHTDEYTDRKNLRQLQESSTILLRLVHSLSIDQLAINLELNKSVDDEINKALLTKTRVSFSSIFRSKAKYEFVC